MYDNLFHNRIIIIFFKTPIVYRDYFLLTKLVHSAFINFQINSFTTCNSDKSIFLLLHSPPVELFQTNYIIQKVHVDFIDFKDWLSAFKKNSIKRYKTISNYYESLEINKKLNFIEELVVQNENYKKTSIRQIKSSYLRKKELLANKYFLDTCEVHTAADLIKYFYCNLEKEWSFVIHYDLPQDLQTKIETCQMSIDLDLDLTVM